MKLGSFALIGVAVAKAPKLKDLDILDGEFFAIDMDEQDRHEGLPDPFENPFVGQDKAPTTQEREKYGACMTGSPHSLNVQGGQHTKNSRWRCGFVNHKRDKGDGKVRPLICFPICTTWDVKDKLKEKDGFYGCRLHAPIDNPKNGFAYCEDKKWVIKNKLKECFCDLCNPADAQKHLRKQQQKGRMENYGANFEEYKNKNMFSGGDFLTHSHQQIIIGSCGKNCVWQPVGFQQAHSNNAAIPQSRDPPTAVCDRKKKVWNFKDKCNCIDLCSAQSPGLPALPTQAAGVNAGWPAHWIFHRPVDTVGAFIDNELGWFNRAEIHCGTEQQILERCGPEGIKIREKNHLFCANGKWISGAKSPITCQCAKKTGSKAGKSKDKHNKEKRPKKQKKERPDGQSSGGPNKPNKLNSNQEHKKHKKNKH